MTEDQASEVFAKLEIAWVTMPSRECDNGESTPTKKPPRFPKGGLFNLVK